MPAPFEFIRPDDKPALLGLTEPSVRSACEATLGKLGYKVHPAANHPDFLLRFSQVQYQVVVLEEQFDGGTLASNPSLQAIQAMPMNQRRHATVFLIGTGFETLHPMQAFQQSVHAVINRANLDSLPQIFQKVIADNDHFLAIYRDAQARLAVG